jgi:hypothetical protein
MITVSVNTLLVAGLSALGVTALFAILVVLFGRFNEFTLKVLASTFALGYYALTSFAAAIDSPVQQVLAPLSLGFGACAALVTLICIWTINHTDGEWPFRTVGFCATAAFTLALGTLNLKFAGASQASFATMLAANGFLVLVFLLLQRLVWGTTLPTTRGYVKTLAASTIAMVALTAANPIVAAMQ